MKPKQNPPNARFWIYHRDGWVKVTVKYDQPFHFFTHAPNEEGYHGTHTTLTHHGDMIHRWHKDYGRDCDGYISTTSQDTCLLARLSARERPANPDDIFKIERGETCPMLGTPDWVPEEDTEVFDETARRHNY